LNGTLNTLNILPENRKKGRENLKSIYCMKGKSNILILFIFFTQAFFYSSYFRALDGILSEKGIDGREPIAFEAAFAVQAAGRNDFTNGFLLTPAGRMLLDVTADSGGKENVFRERLKRYIGDTGAVSKTSLFATENMTPARNLAESFGITERKGAEFGQPEIQRVTGTGEGPLGSQLSEMGGGLPPKEGRRPLSQIGRTPEAARILQTVDELREAQGIPIPMSDVLVREMASKQLAKDPEGARAMLFEKARSGEQLSDIETAIAKEVYNREVEKPGMWSDTKRLADLQELANAWRSTGTPQGRGLRWRRADLSLEDRIIDPDETVVQRKKRNLVEAALEPPQDVQAKIEEAEAKDDKPAARALREEWAGKVVGVLKDAGVDLNKPNVIEQIISDPKVGEKVLRDIGIAKKDNWDALYEYWLNAILSAPQTHIVNIFGTAINSLWHFSGKRALSGLINLVTGDPKGVQPGEMKYVWAGLWPGIQRGMHNFIASWRSELPEFDIETSGGDKQLNLLPQRTEETGAAISGQKGRAIRIPL